MRAEDIAQILHAQPFVPFRIHMSDGRTYEVNHPELVLVFRTYLEIVIPSRRPRIMDRSERCALLHIIRIDFVEQESKQTNN